MSTSLPPPAPKDSSAKYAAIGILLLIGASGAIYLGTRPQPVAPPPPPPPTTVVDAGAPRSVGPTVGAQIDIPVDEPDAGAPAPDAGPTQRTVRYVYRTLPACPGSVDAARTSAVLQQNYGGLRECYNRALRADPNLRGRVTAEFVIQPGGSVGELSTSGALTRNNEFKRCFQGSISRLRFPSPRGGCALFQQSFDFNAGN